MAIIHTIENKPMDTVLEVRDHEEYTEFLFLGMACRYLPERQYVVSLNVDEAKKFRDVLNQFIEKQEKL